MRVPLLQLAVSTLVVRTARSQDAPNATIANGTVQGIYNSHFNQDLFLGIPYGQAPRLDRPKPLDSKFNGTLDASAYGPTCYGFGSNQLLNLTQSEDCLSLNIVRPSGTDITHFPVLVWIYGGGFRQGASADPMWNLSYITNQSVYQGQPIMTVSINYRLAFLGFPGGQEPQDAGVSNLGIRDQRLALQWIQENIAAFGGDPRNVTVWGESAGGDSVATHLIANGGKGSKGLFSRGILVSGFITGENPVYPSKMQAGYDAIAKHAGCDTAADSLACLRTVPITSIYPYEDTYQGWIPTIDGDIIQQPPAQELMDGHVYRVPIILGGNSDEGLFAIGFLPLVNTTTQVRAVLAGTFPTLPNATISKILAAYPPGGPAPPYSLPPDFAWCKAMHAAGLNCSAQYRREAAIIGDFFSGAPRRFMAQHWARLGLPTYSFRFDTNPTALPIHYFAGLGPGFALHGAELAYEFGLPPGFNTPINFYPPVKNVSTHAALSRQMLSRWISFAYEGDPSDYRGDGAPVWPDYRAAGQNYVFNATDAKLNVHVEKDNYREGPIQIWNDNVLAVNYGSAGTPPSSGQ